MNIFEDINRLNLPKGKYVVVGSCVLVALGMVESDGDVDICVTKDIFTDLTDKGWRPEKWQEITVLKHDVYDVGTSFGKWTVTEMLVDALWINDIPFISLDKLAEWKLQMGRPRDLQQFELIKSYQSQHLGNKL